MSNWETKNFTKCISTKTISVDSINARDYKSYGEVPIIDQSSDFIAGYTDNTYKKLKEENLPVVIFGDHTRVFKFIDFPFVAGADGTKILKPENFLEPKYFYYYLKGIKIPNRGYNRHFKLLKETEIRYPALAVQNSIITILDLLSDKIDVSTKKLQYHKQLKQSLMEKLFTEGLYGEELKESEVGLVPESWEVTDLSKYFEIESGKLSISKFEEQSVSTGTDVMYIKVSDMNLVGNEKYIRKAIITKKLFKEEVNKYCLPPKSIVFPKRGAAIATNKKRLTSSFSILDPNCMGIYPTDKNKNNVEFIYYWFLTKDLTKITDPGVTPQINKKDLVNYKVPIPSIDEQNIIVGYLSALDEKIDILLEKTGLYKNLFSSMLQKLMDQEIDVENLEVENI